VPGTSGVTPAFVNWPTTSIGTAEPAAPLTSMGWVMSGAPGTLIGLDAMSAGAEQTMLRSMALPASATPIVKLMFETV
jgi:hypothetical protein